MCDYHPSLFLICDLHLFLQKLGAFFFFTLLNITFSLDLSLNSQYLCGLQQKPTPLGGFILFCFLEVIAYSSFLSVFKEQRVVFKVFKTFLKMEQASWLLFLILIGCISSFLSQASKLGDQMADLHLYNQKLREKLREEENRVGMFRLLLCTLDLGASTLGWCLGGIFQ